MSADVHELAERLNNRIDQLACELLGQPNSALSTSRELRFGKRDSIAVVISGDGAGRWFDHESERGGDGLELICRCRDLTNGPACEWARDWLGEPDTKTADFDTIVAASREPRADALRRYLQRRAIRPDGLPSSIRFRPNAWGAYGALVALATDDTGNVLGLQQIYLTADGQKAPIRVVKRTNKRCDGWSTRASVRLPGNPPLILCEGVETALSLWQATGNETWACLGISNIGKAPVAPNSAVLIGRDGDDPGSKADRQLRKAAARLKGRGHEVRVAAPPQGRDFNDVLREGGEQQVRDLVANARSLEMAVDEWRGGLICSGSGAPRPILTNVIHTLRHAPEWEGVFGFDEFASATVLRRQVPWTRSLRPWEDRDDSLVTEWLQRNEIEVKTHVVAEAIQTIARDNAFHPVRDYLDRLFWDGVTRLDIWLTRYLGAERSPYVCAVGARWLMSAVARIYQPGCKADCALILEGPQGIGKSQALRALSHPWFADRLSDMSSKDAAIETQGVWILELAELDGLSRAAVGTIKAFMSRTHDRIRPPYGRRAVEVPRQCVFAGTVNPGVGYLRDVTGGRRFWPVTCGTIDVAGIGQARDQLWAEARERYRSSLPWWLETPQLQALAAAEQAERYQSDAWEDAIRGHVDGDSWVKDISVAEVFELALHLEKKDWTQIDQNRVAGCLTKLGFEKYRARNGPGNTGSRSWRYRRDDVRVPHLVRSGSGPSMGRQICPLVLLGPSGPSLLFETSLTTYLPIGASPQPVMQ
jgi:phage/plasmid primase-like uncharacterized protein